MMCYLWEGVEETGVQKGYQNFSIDVWNYRIPIDGTQITLFTSLQKVLRSFSIALAPTKPQITRAHISNVIYESLWTNFFFGLTQRQWCFLGMKPTPTTPHPHTTNPTTVLEKAHILTCFNKLKTFSTNILIIEWYDLHRANTDKEAYAQFAWVGLVSSQMNYEWELFGKKTLYLLGG